MQTNEAKKQMEAGFKNVASRMVNAEEGFISTLMKFGNITKEEAQKVLSVYRKLKLVKMDAVNGVLSVKHGAFLERRAINNALA